MIKFTIPIAPVTKKNSQRILKNRRTGKRFIAPSENYEDYEAQALWFIPTLTKPINEPVNVKCLFYMSTRRQCDLPNLLEAIDDCLVKKGLLADDNYKIIATHDGSRVYYDKENPRTEVYIKRGKMRIVDADEIIKQLHKMGGCDAERETWARGWDDAISAAIQIVNDAPTI